MDNEEHIQSTVYTENRLKIPVEELKSGVDEIGCHLQAQRWINGHRDIDSPSIEP